MQSVGLHCLDRIANLIVRRITMSTDTSVNHSTEVPSTRKSDLIIISYTDIRKIIKKY